MATPTTKRKRRKSKPSHEGVADGEAVTVLLRGEEVEAFVKNGKACCSACKRVLPKAGGQLTDEQRALNELRVEKLKLRAFEQMEKIQALIAKTQRRLGDSEEVNIVEVLAEGAELAE